MTLDEPTVTNKMQLLVHDLETANDRRAIFLNCYMMMTGNMLAAVEAGEFYDPGWVRILLHRFADYYFEALKAFDSNPEAAPAIWRRVHTVAHASDTLVIQNLLMGINAHINYDLVLTLVDLLGPGWEQLAADQREHRHSDYCLVNEIIKRTIDQVQDEVVERYSPAMDIVDKSLGPLDEWFISHLITRWRDDVWDQALGLIITADISQRQILLAQIETVTLKRADAILLNNRLSA